MGDAQDELGPLRQADAFRRGRPPSEFTYEPFALDTVAWLEELRLGAREELIEYRLALGRHDEMVSELRT